MISLIHCATQFRRVMETSSIKGKIKFCSPHSPSTGKPKLISFQGTVGKKRWSLTCLFTANNQHDFPASVLEGAGGPPPYIMENKWRSYVTWQQLPRTGAVTSQGSEWEAPRFMANISLVSGSWALPRFQVEILALCDTQYSVCSFFCVCSWLKFQLAEGKHQWP